LFHVQVVVMTTFPELIAWPAPYLAARENSSDARVVVIHTVPAHLTGAFAPPTAGMAAAMDGILH
jgi:hypothetical protein